MPFLGEDSPPFLFFTSFMPPDQVRDYRYHIGESLLPSMKYFLEFIDLYEKFDSHGFLHKVKHINRLLPLVWISNSQYIGRDGP